jgi:hypothetical protein
VPSNEYSVLLPSRAYSESDGMYMNILGMVQKTFNAVHPSVKDTEMLHTTDFVLCSLVCYILRTVTLPGSSNNFSASLFVSNCAHMFALYFPYALNYVHDMSICVHLLRSYIYRMPLHNVVYVLTVRSNYSTDIITRHNVSFMSDADDCGSLIIDTNYGCAI